MKVALMRKIYVIGWNTLEGFLKTEYENLSIQYFPQEHGKMG
jgi:hypothetical protein